VAGVLVATTGRGYWDTLVALAIGIFVAYRAVLLGRDVWRVLAQHAPADMDADEMAGALAAVPGVDDVHDLGLDRDAAAMLMIESDLPGLAGDDELARGEAACVAAGATTTVRSRDAAEADLLRQARRAAHWALEKIGDVKMEDVGVPRSRVPEMLRAIERIAAKHEVRIGTFGHAGDGNLHPDLVLERNDPNGAAITKAVQEDLYQAALDLGGTVTGEHGIGSARVGWLEAQRGADAVRVMRAINLHVLRLDLQFLEQLPRPVLAMLPPFRQRQPQRRLDMFPP
jgi:FAD/FMN-containing dehydrogenase